MQLFSESDMYAPIKAFFIDMGYDVKSEVKNCDITMTKNGELLIIEMKKSFNAKLLYQAIDRQSVTSQVYIAIPRPKRVDKEFVKIKHIVKKLEIGLITIAMDSELKSIDIISFPPASLQTKNPKRKKQIMKEASSRSIDLNEGGSHRKKLATAYREKSIAIACAIEKEGGAIKGTELTKKYECDKYASAILKNNFYGWFDRLDKGIYDLSEDGQKMLDDVTFLELIQFYREKYSCTTY